MCCVELDLHIRHLSIARRSRSCNNKKGIAFHARKVQTLQDSVAVYRAKSENSVTQLKDQVVVQDIEHEFWHAK